MKNAKIIGAFSGTGKSYLAAHENNVLDLDLGRYKFIDDCDPSIPFEARKASKKFKTNPTWPNNYIEAIERNKPLYDIILVSYCPEISHLLEYYFSPSPTGWTFLEQRFCERGNNQRYIDILRTRFEQQTPSGKFVHKYLGENEFLEHALKSEGLL